MIPSVPFLHRITRMSSNQHLTITLNDGSRVPWLGFGTGTALYGRDAAEAVRRAIDNGIIHLDGAQMYNNEDTLGAGIKASGKPRSELYVVTKLKALTPGQTVKESLAMSLEKLGLDYVDLFLIHSPSPSNKEGKLKALWKALEEVHSEGLAKSIGVSNFRVEDLKEVVEGARIVPAINQVSQANHVLLSPPLNTPGGLDRITSIYMEGCRAYCEVWTRTWYRNCLVWRSNSTRTCSGWSRRFGAPRYHCQARKDPRTARLTRASIDQVDSPEGCYCCIVSESVPIIG